MAVDEGTKSQLTALENALTEQLDAYEGELNDKLTRLKDVQKALGSSETVEEQSTSVTAQWYGVFDSYFFQATR